MKAILATILLTIAGPVCAQSTLNLSQSSTFQSKANLASPAFTGVPTAPTAPAGTNTNQIATTQFVNSLTQNNVAFKYQLNAATSSTPNFYLSYGNGPYINFANSTLLTWSATNARFEYYIGQTSSPMQTLSTASATFAVPVVGTGATAFKVAGATGSGFFMGVSASTSRPYVAFDGVATRIEYSGAGPQYLFYIGTNLVASLDGNGTLKTRGAVLQSQGASCC